MSFLRKDGNESSGSKLKFDVPTELADDFAAGKRELKEQGLSRQKAQICVLLDVSTSMQFQNNFFCDQDKKNKVQEALNRILALSFSLDSNQQIDIIPFGDKAYNRVQINRHNYKDATNIVLKSIGKDQSNLFENLKGGTNYAAAIKAMRQLYFKESKPRVKIQPTKNLPVFAILITDGEHNRDEDQAKDQFKFSSYQHVFIKSVGLMGKEMSDEAKAAHFKFLTDMDDARNSETDAEKKSTPKKAQKSCWGWCGFAPDVDEYEFFIDNSDFVAVSDPSKITMEDLIKEFRGWLLEAHDKGIALNKPNLDCDFKDEGRIVVTKKS